MHDLDSLLKESRPTIEPREEHRRGLEQRLRSFGQAPEGLPFGALLLPIAAAILLMFALGEQNQIISPEARLRAQWTHPSADLQPMAWMSPAPIEGYLEARMARDDFSDVASPAEPG